MSLSILRIMKVEVIRARIVVYNVYIRSYIYERRIKRHDVCIRRMGIREGVSVNGDILRYEYSKDDSKQ